MFTILYKVYGKSPLPMTSGQKTTSIIRANHILNSLAAHSVPQLSETFGSCTEVDTLLYGGDYAALIATYCNTCLFQF